MELVALPTQEPVESVEVLKRRERIASLSRELIPFVEVDRAKNLLADLEQESVSARQAWRVSSARLTQVLRINPRAWLSRSSTIISRTC